MRKLVWEDNPDLGFWIDNDPVRLYCGSPFTPEIISKIGFRSRRWVTLSLDPYTASRRIEDDGYVYLMEVPGRWLMDHMDQRLGGNKNLQQKRLLEKDSYLKWSRMDYEYYADSQIRVVNSVPVRYIVGYFQRTQ